MESRDETLDTLLDLDGQILVLDEKGEYWVKFNVRRVAGTPERPHGLNYSLTLHGKDNERVVGFDNAHPARHSSRPGGKGRRLTITNTASGRFGRINIAMQPPCLRTSGPKWMPY